MAANIVSKAARGVARVLGKLTADQRDAAIAWAIEKLGGVPPKRRKRRAKAEATNPAPAPAPRKATAAKPTAHRVVRKAAMPAKDEDEDDE